MAARHFSESEGNKTGEQGASPTAGADGIEALARRLAERDARIDELASLAERREAEWRRLVNKRDNRILTLAKRMMKRDQMAAAARAEAEEAKAAAKKADEIVAQMQRSTSWRVTAPLRAIVDFGKHRNRRRDAKPRRPAPKPEAPSAEPPKAPDSAWEIGLMKTPAIRPGKRGRGRIAVFTAVVDGYDTVREPTVIDPTADYYLFTDAPVPEGSVWQRRDFDFRSPDPTRTARFVKTHPHRYFPDHDWAMWMDGNLRLATLPEDFISDENADRDIIAWQHPDRDCVYDELEECIALNKDDEALMRRQIDGLRASGYPEHNGLITSCVMVYRHRRPEVAALLDDWWHAIETGSRRDQLSFNPTLHRHPGIKLGYLAPRGVEMHNDPRVLYGHHRPVKNGDETPERAADDEE